GRRRVDPHGQHPSADAPRSDHDAIFVSLRISLHGKPATDQLRSVLVRENLGQNAAAHGGNFRGIDRNIVQADLDDVPKEFRLDLATRDSSVEEKIHARSVADLNLLERGQSRSARRPERRQKQERRKSEPKNSQGSHPALHFSCSIRSTGEMMSVRRIPNFSVTTTTSPRAMSFSLTSTSRGSPANFESSTTEPCASWRISRIAILDRKS